MRTITVKELKFKSLKEIKKYVKTLNKEEKLKFYKEFDEALKAQGLIKRTRPVFITS